MPIPADILTQLADVLAELYNDPASARTMAITAGLRVERIASDAKPLNYWVAILGEAEAYGATQILLDRAVAQYPVHAPLAALHQAYTAWLLPPLPPLDLPDKPYRYLDWYRREDAEVFFGRGREIRMLVERITAADGPPIVLLYGQSGVGKSSLLEAGLLPRIDGSRVVHYLRRDQGNGLLGTVTAALDASPGDDLAARWFRLEAQNGRPLLVILDQVEEVYTRPNVQLPDELADFLTALEGLFADARRRPQGRLILGFRKEWLAEINRCLAERNLPRGEVFLERLGRVGIAEVVAGPQSTLRLRSHFGLDVTATLPGLIADDLLADRESPVAPMLAILLTDMWDAAKKHRYDHPTFDEDLYHDFRRRGLSLDDFLGRQLRALQDRLPEVVDSGLVLDLLAYHTTPLGTAAQRTPTEIEETYRHRQDVLPALVLACQDLYLLVDPSQNQPNQPRASRLAHDTLAPHVRKRFDESDAPGQRARRILENRRVEWKDSAVGPVLDGTDLATVEVGRTGMRDWDKQKGEERLIQASRLARRRRGVAKIASVAVALAFVALVGSYVLQAYQEWDYRQQARLQNPYIHIPDTNISIQKYEVSNHLFALFLQATARDDTTAQLGSQLPMTDIDAQQALRFCNWIGGTLPSKEEWLSAARRPASDHKCPGRKQGPGSNWANIVGISSSETAVEVADSSYGCDITEDAVYHLWGNVLEWTRSTQAAGVWTGSDPRATLAVMGGSFTQPLSNNGIPLTIAADLKDNDLGFRCLLVN